MPIRCDRAVSLYVFQTIRRALPVRQTAVPILMYHRVPHSDDCTGHPYYCTNTDARRFEQQIRLLRDNGYRGVSIRDVLLPPRTRSERRVAITFDDGYRDFYTNAFPILHRYGFLAAVFLPTAYIGDETCRFKDAECLTWHEVRELQKVGVEFGSHTVTHPQLRDVTARQMQEEVALSKVCIEDKIGEAVELFSYPYAFPETDRRFVAAFCRCLTECGYRAGVSTIIGRARTTDNRLFMRRLPVNSHDDLRFFRAKLEGGYDWLHPVQYASKLTTARLRLHRAGSSRVATNTMK